MTNPETINLRPDERQDPLVQEVIAQGADLDTLRIARPFTEMPQQYIRNRMVANVRKAGLLKPEVSTYFAGC